MTGNETKRMIEKKLHKAVKTIAVSHNHNEKGNTFLIEVGKLLDNIENPDNMQKDAIEFYNKYVIVN